MSDCVIKAVPFRAFAKVLLLCLATWLGVQSAQAQSACTYAVTGPAGGTTIDVGGTSVSLADDAITGAIGIGFNFNFFGTNYSNFVISSNGFISFDLAAANGCCSGQVLPNAGAPNAVVAGFWEDFNPPLGGSIGYGVFGAAPNRRLVVSFTDIQHFGGGNNATFQIKLHETTNVIEVVSISCTSDGGFHTLGIEDISGTLGFAAPGRNSTSWSSFGETTTFTPIDQTAPIANCPGNISIPCSAPVSYSVSGSDGCQFARINLIGGLASGSTFPTGTTTVTFRARDHGNAGVFNNGAGGTFSYNEGDNSQTVALKACESVYGAGNCVIGACGSFTYYYRNGHLSCNCGKTPGQYEFIYSNTGYTDVGQDYGGNNAPVNFVPFVRVKGNGGCSVPNTWQLANDRLGGNFADCSFNVTAGSGVTPANAGPDQTVCSTSATLAGNSPSVGSGSWSIISGGGGSVATPSSPSSGFTGVVGTTYTLRWTVSFSGCPSSTDDVIITMLSSSSAPTSIGGTTSICAGSNTTLTVGGGALGSGGSIQWFSGSCGSGVISTASSITVAPGSTTTYFVRYTGTCNTTACVSATVNVTQTTTASNAGPDQTVCGTSTSLAGNTPSAGTGSWSIISGSGGSVGTPSSPTSGFSGVAGTTYTLRWTISNAPCAATSDDVLITFIGSPTASNAGPDQNICATSTNLAGNAPGVGTGSWSIISGSAGSVTTPSSPTSAFNGLAGNTYTLRWTISNSPCPASIDDVIIVFTANPNGSNAGPDQTICGTSTTLAGNAATTGSGSWSILSGAGGSVTTPGSPSSSFTGVAGTSYTLRWTISNSPCPASFDDVVIIFRANPTTSNAGPDQTLCATSATLAGNTPSVGTGAWSIISGAGGSVTTPSSATSGFTGTAGTTYTLRWTISNSPCTASIDDVVITFVGSPTAANAGPDQALCATSTTLAGNAPSVGSGAWSIISGAGGSVTTPSSATSGFTGTAGTTYTLRWTISNSPCTPSTDDVVITFTGNPSASNAGPDQTLCATSTTLAGNAPSVGSGSWSIISGAGGSVTTPSSASSAFTGVAGTTYTLRWTISNSPCAPATDDVVISFTGNPTASNAGPDQTLCATSATLAGNTPGVGSGSWSIISGAGGSVTTPGSATSAFTGVAGTTYTLRWTISNSPCAPSTDDVIIILRANPTTSNAGPDQTLCATSATLAGNTPTVGTGAWSIISGTGGTVVTPSSATSTFTGVAGNTYTLRWTISNSPCTASTDDVVITFTANPTTSNAGPDQTLCGSSTTLSGNTPTVGTGSWSVISGTGGTITTPSSPTSGFSGLAGTTYTLRWTISNSPCAASTDDVVITFTANPTTSNAGPDQNLCATSATLAANTPTVGTGAWSIISGAGGSVTTPCSASSAFTGVAGTTYTLRWTISNSPCAASTDDVVITFTANPTTSNAGPDQTLCATSTNLAGNTPTVGTGSWSIISGAGGSVTTPSSTTSAFTGVAGTTYTLRWTISNSPCVASTDDVVITFNASSVAPTGVSGTSTICLGQSTTLTVAGGSPGAGGVTQWFTGSCGGTSAGTGSSITVAPTVTTTYFVRYAGTCNTTTCASVTVTVNSFSTAPTSISGTTSICPTTSTTLTQVGGSLGSGAVYNWYSGSCGGVLVGTGNSVTVTPSATTTYFVLAQGTCNTTTCASVTVTVGDASPPAITCPSNASIGTTSGLCSATYTYTAPVGTDNCPSPTTTQTAGLASGASFPIGVTTNIFRVTDGSGNTATCSFTVTVTDNQLPTITCPANVSVNANTGTCSATATYTPPVGADNCPASTTTQTAGQASGATYSVGSTINTFRVTDAAGNTATCSFSVTVVDAQIPVVTCPANVSVNSTTGTCGAVVTYTTPLGTDNCPSPVTTLTAGLASGSSFPVGTTTNTYRVTDASGNTATCSFTITVSDIEAPTITCPSNISVNASVGACNATVTYTAPVGADNCPGATTSQTAGLTSGASFPVGVTTNTFRVTAANGAFIACSFTVTVVDNQLPTISCPSNIIVNAAVGTCAATVTYSTPTGTDNCAGSVTTQTVGLPSGGSFPVGTSTNTFRVTDASGNTATCSFTVKVNDTQVPIINCPTNISVNASLGVCSAVVTYSAPVGTDNCPGANTSQIAGQSSGTSFPVGTITNSFKVTDAVGNSASCSFTVTVVDNQLPVITCPANISVNAPVGSCNAVVTYTTPSGTDNCPSPTSVQIAGLASGATYPVGITTNTFRVTDASSNTATCSFTITVNDNEAPTISCPANQSVSASVGACSATVTYVSPVGADNCPGATTLQTTGLASGAAFPVGITTNTYRVTAANGTTTTCSFTVTVTDAQGPTISCPANMSVNASVGACSATVTYTAPVGADNCPGATTIRTTGIASGGTFPIGATTNTFQVTDASGNTASCSFTVTVIDNQAPTITCPANQSVNASVGGCSATATYTAPVGTDNCPGATTTLSSGLASGATYPVGTSINTYLVTDAAGNTATCSFTITVVDNQAPTITCPANQSVSASVGACTATATYTAPIGSDNCPGATTIRTTGLASGSTFPSGTTTNTFQVTDASGNTATCSFTVTVIDNQAPTISCPANQSVNASVGLCSATVTYTAPVGTDNCPGANTIRTTGLASGSSFPVGLTTNTFQVTDAAGNTATCSFTVTVIDNQAPTISCPSNQSVNASVGTCAATVTYTAPVGTDNCVGATTVRTTGLASGSSFPVGVTTNVFTVTDASGNTATCSFTVTVIDNQAPTISCPSNISVSASVGACSATVTYTAPVGADNCAGSTTIRTTGLASGSSFPVGVTTNTFQVTDASGNTATCSFTVTVIDNQPPTISCPSNIVVNNDPGLCSAVVTYAAPVGTDNCTGQTTVLTSGLGSGATYPLGTSTNTYTVTAANGQTASCSFTVTVNNADIDVLGNGISIVDGDITPNAADLTDFGTPFPGVPVTHTFTISNTGTAPLNVSTISMTGPQAASFTVGGISLPAVVAPGGSTTFTVTFVGVSIGVYNATVVLGNSDCDEGTYDFAVLGEVTCQPTAVTSCPSNMTLNTTSSSCTQFVNYTTTFSGSPTPTLAYSFSGATTGSGVGTGSGSIFNLGLTTVVVTATNPCGTATCTFTVQINDITPPTALCHNVTVQLNASGTGSTTAAAVNNGSTDNCTIASLAISNSAFTCVHVGANTTVLTVTDGSGNTSTCSATVTVQDNIAPVAVCQNVTVQLNASGTASTTAAAINNGSSDACGISSISVSMSAFTCAQVGANTVILSVTDVNGNTGTCSATVTVQDNIAPVAVCQNVTVQLNAGGTGSTTAAAVNNGSTDNCSVASLSLNNSTFTCANVGSNTVVLTATDASGNTATCSATVAVQDNVAPVAVCQSITAQLNASGSATITAAQVNNGSSDACGISSVSVSASAFTCAHVGANTVILTVTDVNGNTSTCTSTVTVQDNVAPTAVCQNITTQLNASGGVTITASQINNGSSDACGIASLALNNNTFSCANVGANTVILTVTDVNGNASTCTSTVTVQDNIAPVAVCQNITAQLNASGGVTITAAQVNNGSSDACGIASLALNNNTFTCANVGANTVILTVTDVNGNTATCTSTVTVQDNVAPTAICQNITAQLNSSGSATITAAQVNNGSSDACGISSVSVSASAFTCANVGANTVILTVTDVNGNSSTCTATVTVQDLVPPTAVCQSITTQLNASGNATITAAQINNGSTDNCGIASLGLSNSAFTCANVGANTVVLTVTDVNGNTSTCSATVTVQDNVAPVAVCQNITAQLNASGGVTITAAQVNNGSSDACGIASLTLNNSAFTCANVGANTVILTVTDVNGNTATCTSTVTVQDNVAPTAICQNITAQLNSSGSATITAAQVNNGSSDACGISSVSVSASAFTCANVGANTVILTVTDVNGNSSTCTATVTVQDLVPPTAVCQSITTQLNASGNATITAAQINNGSTDNCGIASLGLSNSAFTCANVGANTVVLTVTDVNGNTSTCTATVTVQDNVAPVAVCQNITAQLNASGGVTITAAQINNGSSDACGIASLALNNSAFTCANVGANTVILTVTDVNGNTATCTSTVTVQDNVAPTAICQNITVQLNSSGSATITAAQINNGSSDACGIASLSLNTTTFTCTGVGANTVILTVTDVNGNSSTCTATVTVQDIVPPTAVCQSITTQLNASGNATITAAQINNGSTDNCGIASLTLSNSAFTCANVGANTVILTVTDVNGNTSTCSATVTVQDNIAPVAICQNITAQLNASGGVTITAAQVNNGSSDACGIASLTLNNSAFTCANVGANTVILTVTDVNGNTATCTSTVTVQDNVAPTAVCQNITVQLNSSGSATITAAQVNNGSFDACGISSVSVSASAFTCANVGANTVILTVTDVNGNSSTCTATVTVQDIVPPTAVCQSITTQLDNTGNATITATQINNGSTDNCGIASLTLSNSAFTCANVGANTVVLTVTDVNGNTSTCSSTVTVQDNIAPVAICQNITAQLNASGGVTITAAQVDNGSSDACGISSVGVSVSAFTCANVGANTVILTVTDVNGNSSTCVATVTVEDNVAPTAICQNITTQLNSSGSATITAAQVDNGSSDACGVSSVSVDVSAFTCANVGANTVILTVTDVNGNSSTCTATVTVQDIVPPTAVCQSITTQLDNTGNATITAAQINNGSTDNCGIASLTLNNSAFTCANVGANTVVLTVTDVNGNTSTCTATVTVEDNVAPVAICQNITAQLNSTGNATITTAQVDNGSTDACGISTLSLSVSAFTCANVGANTVVLTVTDVNGNSSTCTATVTVEDNVAPAAICQNLTIQLNSSGNATITAAQVNNGSSDACGISSVSVNVSAFTCANVGANTVILTVTDVNGNTSTCTSTVTVQDIVAPTAVCQNITTQLNSSGNATITAAQVDNGSSDNCSIASLILSNSAFTCANVGANTVVLTVADANGNTSTCTATVTVEDNIAPVAICQNITAQLNSTGNATITAAQISNGSSDACGIASLSLSVSAFTCANVGANTVVLTVTDVNGNSSTCSATVTVQDNVAPTAVCQNITTQLNSSGSATITAAQVNNGSSDACGISSVSVNVSAFTCANVGANTVILTVTDVNGNSSTCTSTVTVQDNVAPVAICQGVTTQLSSSGNATITAAQVNNGSTDACGISSVSVSVSAFTCANVGANTVVLTATDASGNTNTCTAIVTVQDNVAPIAICQNVTVQLNSSGAGSTTGAAVNNGSSDACGIASLVATPNTFDCSNVGSRTITLTVTDVNGNTSTCTSTVVIQDNIAPVALCQNVTLQLNNIGFGSTNAAAVNNGSSDACGINNVTLSTSTFGCANVGINTVTLTVTDANNNTSTCAATVTVQDLIAPVANCQNTTVQLNASGTASVAPTAVNNASSDACGIGNLSLSVSAFTCANIGTNATVLTVTDVNGNTSTCTATVTVQDQMAPVATCQNVTVQLNASGTGSTTAAAVNNNSTDNCAIASMGLNNTAFTCANVGANTVILTVTDVNGNSSTCSATVTIQDQIAPVATCQNVTVQLNASGTGSTTAAAINNGSTDNCAINTVSLSNSAFTCTNVGANTVTLIVTDVNGNTSTCTATVTVQDQIAPVATCHNLTVQLNASGNASTTATAVNNGSTDACGISSVSVSVSTFTCANIGPNSVTLTVTDVNGNSSTCGATVTVVDLIAPSITCPSNFSLIADSVSCGAVANWPTPNPIDNCGAPTFTGSHASGSTFPTGATTVTYTATDASGNSASCAFTVTVTARPLRIVATTTLQGCGYTLACANDNNGTATSNASGGCLPYTYAWSNGGTSANATGLSAGTYYVTVTDVQNHVAMDTIVVTAPSPLVVATTGTTVVCQGGNSGQLAASAGGGQTCAGYTFLWSTGATTGSIGGLMAGNYGVTVTDASGCTATASATIQVGPNPVLNLGNDTIACPGIPVSFQAPSGYASYHWSNGATSQAVLVAGAGNYSCTVTTVDGCQGADTVAISLYTVNNNLITAVGTTTLCIGDSVQLVGVGGHTGYFWSTSQSTPSIFVTGFGGNVSLEATDLHGCVAHDTIFVDFHNFAHPQPVITPGPNAFICDNNNLTLDAGQGFFGYLWSTGGATQLINTTTPGVYQVTVSNGFGCTGVSAPVTVTAATGPSPIILFIGGQLSTSQPYQTYQWYLNGNLLPNATSATHTPVFAGNYTVVVTDANGCPGTSASFHYPVVGVTQTVDQLQGLVLYPNPGRDILNLRTLEPIDWPLEVEVWDIYGKKVKAYDMAHLMDMISFDMSDLAKGSYVMKITTYVRNTTRQAVIKFVLQ